MRLYLLLCIKKGDEKALEESSPRARVSISCASIVCTSCSRKKNLCTIPTKYDYNAHTARESFFGRNYADLPALGLSRSEFIEMDTVLSATGSLKCILTIYFPGTELILAHLMNRCTPGAVRLIFEQVQKSLGGAYEFISLFLLILTDPGGIRGSGPSGDSPGWYAEDQHLLLCPMRSNQNGGIENVHTMLRMILPKGTVFEQLTQWDIRKAVNHINSVTRGNLSRETSYRPALKNMAPIYSKPGSLHSSFQMK